MKTGTVKFYNAAKGYGFARPDGEPKDVFLHVSELERAGISQLHEGERISFDIELDKKGKGPRAVLIRVEGGRTTPPASALSQRVDADRVFKS